MNEIIVGVRDKANRLIHWFQDEEAANQYITEHDPEGSKGFHLIRRK